ncbi:MAG: NADH-quinone oxidoreductase subunit NuoI [Chloroflexota bacterium]|nr:NADH-quinone oxidoreductase subunit NuoI [Chloroflexota bacterium]
MPRPVQTITGIVRGLGTTLRQIGRRPVTYQYPEQPKPVARRFRGLHKLQRYANGMERCIGCSLCAAACPSRAIYVEAADNPRDNPVSPGERYAQRYEINMIRCIFCGFCEEACPTGAIVLGTKYELADFERNDFIYTKERLLVPPDQGFGEPSELKPSKQIGDVGYMETVG